MTAATKPYNEGTTSGAQKNEGLTGPPGSMTAVLGSISGVRWVKFKNMTQYVTVRNHWAGALKIGWNNVATKGINGVTTLTAMYDELPAFTGVFSQPIQVGQIFFQAVADTRFSMTVTFSPETPVAMEMFAADQFDFVEEVTVLETNLP